MTINPLLFIVLQSTIEHLTSLNVPYIEVLSTPSRVNYVANSPMFPIIDASDPPTICWIYFDLDPVIDMVDPSMGTFEPDSIIPIGSLNMCSFDRIILPSYEDILEAMVGKCPLACVSSKWKP